jgi:mono/diheme cytochrome c family protein
VQHGRCKHYAALMSALGWIGTTPEPEPTAPATGPAVCGHCNGLGETQYTRGTGRGRYQYDWQTCSACHGAGTELTETLEAA